MAQTDTQVVPLTKSNLIREVWQIYDGLIEVLSYCVFHEDLADQYRAITDPGPRRSNEIPRDLYAVRGTDAIMRMYDYGVCGRSSDFEDDLLGYWDEAHQFTELAAAAARSNPACAEPVLCRQAFEAGNARLKLDAGNDIVEEFLMPTDLTLREVAVLAGMTERSVRNATLASAKDRLKTFQSGSSVYVDAREALRWLRGRRGFVETVVN
ncbi:hypothetical protein H0Z60_14550 [Ectothiorhodospiraceae bacterium WFHF3C12]|nr:hypothetical protein [Ectothiorhodospiraceae bacterium WFHF3C12]